MIRVLISAGVLALMVGLFGIGSAQAAPDNKKTTTFDVSCDPPLGDLTVSSNGSGPVVFTEDGQVLVAKHITGTSNATLAVEGGPTIPLEPQQFTEGGNGNGPKRDLVSCDFTIQFEFQFTLKAKDAAAFGLSDSFIGATATITDTTTGTAEVLVPGG